MGASLDPATHPADTSLRETWADGLITANADLHSVSKCCAAKGKLSQGMLITSGTVPFSGGLALISKWLLKANSPQGGGLACACALKSPLLSQGCPRKWNPP